MLEQVIGCNVVAAADGDVVTVKDLGNSSFGKYIVIYHRSTGKHSLYAHLSAFSVRQGQSVRQGDVIGKSGNSGGVRPHLHFEIEGVHPYEYFKEIGDL